jgi:DNA primase catalytic core
VQRTSRRYKALARLWSVVFVLRCILSSTPFTTRPLIGHWIARSHRPAYLKERVDDSSTHRRSFRSEPLDSEEGQGTEEQLRLPQTSSSNKSFGIDADRCEVLKRSIDIVSVVETYGLDRFERKSSTRATACCPFHKDKSPSLSVDAGRGIYKCFGCGAGGDVFSFVREYAKLKGEAMTYYQSIRRVQDEWGDPTLAVFSESMSRLPTKSPEEEEKLRHRKERVLAANRAAAAFYAACLLQPRAGAVRSYIRSRGIAASTVSAFGLGYAPNVYPTNGLRATGSDSASGDGGLSEHLQTLGFTIPEILDAGLATQTKTKAAFSQVMHTEVNLVANATEGTSYCFDSRLTQLIPHTGFHSDKGD